ncbi:MAG: hypothetical protein ACOY4I_09960 [Bacillota bacterium]
MSLVKEKAKFISIMGMVFIYMFLLSSETVFANSSFDDQYGIYYRHGRVFGKIIHFDSERDLVIIYGSLFVAEPGGQWRRVESRKFHPVNPVGNDIHDTMAGSVGRTVGAEGQLLAWPGQKEEILVAQSVDFHDYPIETPPWCAFGVTIRPERIYKFNLDDITKFVNILSGLQQAANIPQSSRLTGVEISKISTRITNFETWDRELSSRVKREIEKSWNEKWCVTRDSRVSNELRAGVGGWQFYQGLLGYSNCYISSAPVIRKNITAFMDAVRAGSGSHKESGPAVMCACVTVERDRFGKVIEVKASGALYDSVSDLLEIIKNPVGINLETWRLEGWNQEVAKVMEGKLCWLSGSRVLVYKTDPGTGRRYLADQYFTLDEYLTRDGFDNVLDVGNSLIGEGGF